MKKKLSRYYVLGLLALMFAAPGIAALIFYQHPSWLGASKVNKGTLLNPPIVWNALNSKEAKWRIVFWNPQACDELCLKRVNMLARVRLALGRKLYQVEQSLVLSSDAIPLSDTVKAILKEQDFHVMYLSQQLAKPLNATEPQIFIANPENYLILAYKPQVNPEDIYKDLKLLLNTAEQKSG